MSAPVVTWALILINVIAFLYELAQPNVQAFLQTWGVVPAEISRGQDLITLITSMFLHGGWMHLIGNMVFLWVFGDNVEDALGKPLYAVFYFLTGIAAGLAQVFLSPSSTLPAVGASGAISGVLAAYLVMFGRNRVRVLIFNTISTVPAYLMIGLWILFQFFNGIASFAQTEETGGVAYGAHVGGFVAGLVLAIALRGITRRTQLATR